MDIYIAYFGNGRGYHYYINKDCVNFLVHFNENESSFIRVDKNIDKDYPKNDYKKLNNINVFYKDLFDSIFISGIYSVNNNYHKDETNTELFKIFDILK